jgi:mRNA-degrading endonuclease RelE of RelBE toxin-antitoxin system
MEIIFSQEFAEEYKKIKDNATRLRIIKQIKKLEQQPDVGKPLKHELKNHRSLRVPPFRVIYRIEQDRILINCFEHRDKVYR